MPEKRNRLRMLLRYLGQPENLTNLVAVVVTIVLGYRSIRSGGMDEYLQAVLAVLGILALAQLVTGFEAGQRDARVQRLTNVTEQLGQRLLSHSSADRLFRRRGVLPPVESALDSASHIDVLGISLLSLAVVHHSFLKRKWEEGCRIRLMCTDPGDLQVAQLAATRVPEVQSADTHVSHVKTALKALSAIAGRSASGGSLEVHLLRSFPSFGILIIDGSSTHGRLRVELYPDGCSLDDRPVIELRSFQDGAWYDVFRQHFEAMWDGSKPVDNESVSAD